MSPYPHPLSLLSQTFVDQLLDLLHLLDLSHLLSRLPLASAYQPAYQTYTPTDLTYQRSPPIRPHSVAFARPSLTSY